MAEQDPRDYRGGAHEPEDAKPGEADNEGMVPREMLDRLSHPLDDSAHLVAAE